MGGIPRVLLIGMTGAGKSTVGHALSELTGWPYLDNDELVERATGRPGAELLRAVDEPTRRQVEKAALDEALAAEPPAIAAVDPGVIIDPVARQRIDDAFVVYLHAPLALLAERAREGPDRPSPEGPDPAEEPDRLYEGREPLYREAADLVLEADGVSPDELANRIVRAVGG
jgi:shikimate kinase